MGSVPAVSSDLLTGNKVTHDRRNRFLGDEEGIGVDIQDPSSRETLNHYGAKYMLGYKTVFKTMCSYKGVQTTYKLCFRLTKI